MSSGPGALLQLDSTLADVYLVSSLNRRWIIGRPVITIVIDVFSWMIVGFNVSLKNPGWETASLALEHITTDKVAYCRQFGETITEADWTRAPEVLAGTTPDRAYGAQDAEFLLRAIAPL